MLPHSLCVCNPTFILVFHATVPHINRFTALTPWAVSARGRQALSVSSEVDFAVFVLSMWQTPNRCCNLHRLKYETPCFQETESDKHIAVWVCLRPVWAAPREPRGHLPTYCVFSWTQSQHYLEIRKYIHVYECNICVEYLYQWQREQEQRKRYRCTLKTILHRPQESKASAPRSCGCNSALPTTDPLWVIKFPPSFWPV